jgi:hypothetical protein
MLIVIAFQLCIRICLQEGFDLKGTHQLLVYGDSVNVLGEDISMIKNTETVLRPSREAGLEGSTEKSKHMAVSSPECRAKSQFTDS